ncbi:MAG: inositol monophosphatase family protein [Bacteroidota bacterium]|nr:inositol monophosphatase family protein [Bacteroidota bacterium]
MDLEKICTDVRRLTTETAGFIQQELNKLKVSDIEVKSENNFVTYVDKTSETRLMEGLSKILPGSGFIAEESPDLQRKELTWVIDPLDGTTNFIHHIPMYCISIALMEGNDIRLGVVHELNRDECFYTWKDAPSFLNGRQIRVSDTHLLKDSLLATGFPYYDFNRLDAYMHLFRYFMKHTQGVRRIGSAAADLAYVACGRFDGFYEYGLSPWDVAGGIILIRNAGGKVFDFKRGDNYIFGKEIIATNGLIPDEFLETFEKNFL